jgi:predicted AAA+ superfamily ATPase
MGARQTGKTTLVRAQPWLRDRPYLTLDDFDLRAQAMGDPESVIARAPKLILDEVQRARDLRIAFERWREVLAAHAGPREDWREATQLGGFPVPARELDGAEARALWFSGYVQTYLERDLPALRAVENLADFRRLMRGASLRIGNLLNQAELGRDVGISQPQVHRFLNLMEASYLAIRLPAYSVNRTRRLIKAPKLYWCDTALALHLGGEPEPRGAHLENLVLLDLLAWREIEPRRPEILYWRTATGQEVDFVLETPRRLVPVEVKAAPRVTPADARGLEAFLDEYAGTVDGALLLYAGTDTFPLTRRVLAAPWWTVC